ncbi:hypothetical protein SPSIL_014750 [Sporomusa silvacetica DSM 10669]|uniref:Uncharacterized protein n=1 Tax=Sporomusa silvacetica DSM 10669 TaxID=1123289 RepID=A0ABZ3II62_9FIRM|nr:hypothetical protein SPSIL_09480 [Sporomusa silvacetica DSM 10669]
MANKKGNTVLKESPDDIAIDNEEMIPYLLKVILHKIIFEQKLNCELWLLWLVGIQLTNV